MPNVLRTICLGALLACGLGGCSRAPENEAVSVSDLQSFLTPGPGLQETLKAQEAEEARFIRDWRLHAAERGWELTRPSGMADREEARTCLPSFEAHYGKRSAALYQPGSLELSPDSLRVGLMENGIRIGTVRASLRGTAQPVHEEIIVFRFGACDVIAAQYVEDLVSLSVKTGGDAAGEATDERKMALWRNGREALEVRVNARRNAVAIYVEKNLVRADLDLWTEDACSLADPAWPEVPPDGSPTLDRICPGAQATVTPTLVETYLWLNLFGADDMAAHLASEDRPDTILIDRSKRPGVQAPYLLDVHAMQEPDPGSAGQPRPEDLLFLYPLPLGSPQAEKK